MQESTITQRGQTTLPRDIRAALDLRAGDRLRYIILDDGQVRLLRSRPALDLAGVLRRDRAAAVSLDAMHAVRGRDNR